MSLYDVLSGPSNVSPLAGVLLGWEQPLNPSAIYTLMNSVECYALLYSIPSSAVWDVATGERIRV